MYILCSPVFVPHITGGLDPDEPEMVKLSVLPKARKKKHCMWLDLLTKWYNINLFSFFIYSHNLHCVHNIFEATAFGASLWTAAP